MTEASRDDRGAAACILVGVDASAGSLEAIEAAAVLAERLGAHLAGVFVEDAALLRAAGLPLAGVVRAPSGTRQRLDPVQAERELRALAARARDAFERVAVARRLPSSFRVVRGVVARALLDAAAGADLLVLGAGPSRSGAVRAAARAAPCPVLLLGRGVGDEAAAVIVDASLRGERSPRVAACLVIAPGPGVALRWSVARVLWALDAPALRARERGSPRGGA